MFLPERNTHSRSRPADFSFSDLRTRAPRRSIWVSFAIVSALLLLSFLAEDVFPGVFHSLALVGLGLTKGADLGGNLAYLLLVDAGNDDFGGLGSSDRNAGGDRVADIVAVAELQLQLLALHRRAIA